MSAPRLDGLLASAQEFIAESLANFADHRPRFAVVHAVTATELVLKARLARVNPALILRNIDSRTPDKEPSVSLSALPLRLANLGLPLTSAQSQLIGSIAEWRNQIVHHVPTFDIRAAQQQLPQLLDFIAGYLRMELETPLEKFLPKKLYRVAHRLLSDWQKALKSAQAIATAEGRVLQDTCPRCGGSGVMCLRADCAVHCHLCGAELFRLDSCNGCGRRTVTSYGITFGENFCDDCIEAAGDQYIQEQIDLARGK